MMMMMISVPMPMYMGLLWSVKSRLPRRPRAQPIPDGCQWPTTVPPSGAIGRCSSCQRCMPPAIE
jgi:hypothetical protein